MNEYASQTSVTGVLSSSPSATTCSPAATMAAAAAAHFYQQQQQLHAAAAAAAAMDHNPGGHHHPPLAAAAAVAAAAVGSVDTPRYPWMSITGERSFFSSRDDVRWCQLHLLSCFLFHSHFPHPQSPVWLI